MHKLNDRKTNNCFLGRIFGLQKMLFLNHSGRPGGTTDRRKSHSVTLVLVKVNVMSTLSLLCSYRLEKDKMQEKMKEGELLQEVDDSGFFAGKAVLPPFFSVCNSVEFTHFFLSPFPIHPFSRWTDP